MSGPFTNIASALASGTPIEDGEPADKIGCVHDHTKHGGTIVERLIALSDHDHPQTDTILESPLGVID